MLPKSRIPGKTTQFGRLDHQQLRLETALNFSQKENAKIKKNGTQISAPHNWGLLAILVKLQTAKVIKPSSRCRVAQRSTRVSKANLIPEF
jgi:hypothetical protein